MSPSSAIRTLLFVSLLCVFPHPAQAQPTLNFQRLRTTWPTVELAFTVACGGLTTVNFDAQHCEVYEDGMPVTDFTLTRPDSTLDYPFSAALVFDCSGSMAGAPIAGAINAGQRFVRHMNGTSDEACVIGFETSVHLLQTMTSDTALLNTAIGGMVTGNMTGLWDACYEGLQQIINSGSNDIRCLIVVADGDDNTSTHTPATIITIAAANDIHVYTIRLGSGNQGDLQNMAMQTSGKYYSTSTPSGLAAIYDAIYNDLSLPLKQIPCKITYSTECMDGATRTVKLVVKDVCGGADRKTKTYVAPKDTTTYTPVDLRLGSVTATMGQPAIVPLILGGPGVGHVMFPAYFNVRLGNAGCGLHFDSIRTGANTLLDDSLFSVTVNANDVQIRIRNQAAISGGGVLAELVYSTSPIADTCHTSVSFVTWSFDRGCYQPVLADGAITVVPLETMISGSIMAPDSMHWDPEVRAYLPQPLHVSMYVVNTGFKDATNARFTISYNNADFQLLNPLAATQPGSPPVVAKNGGGSIASWDMLPRNRTSTDLCEICITAAFDNHPDVTSCLKVVVDRTGPIPVCTLTAPEIEVGGLGHGYMPMPFTATATVTNVGGSDADTLWATITLPPGMTLAGADASGAFRKKMTDMLPVNGHASVSWELHHPITPVEVNALLRVRVTTSDEDNSTCDYTVTIPPINSPVLSLHCAVPDDLAFDENLNAYVPYPFEVSVLCRNLGTKDALNATAFLMMPQNVVLYDARDSLRRTFTPQTLTSTNTMPSTLTWTVRYAAFPHTEDSLVFRFVAGCRDSSGVRTDSAFSSCTVMMPPLLPVSITGSTVLCAGDSVRLDAGPGYRSWRWSRGDTTRMIHARTPGAYQCTMIDMSGRHQFTRVVTVTQRTLVPGVTARDGTLLCVGGSTLLTADSGYASYVWNTGAVSQSITVRDTGRYTCTVIDAGGCTGVSLPVHITFRPAINPVITAIGHTPICAGDSLVLDAGPGYRSHLWNTGERTRTIVVKSAGAYTCTVEDSNACFAFTPPFPVTVQTPPVPVITYSVSPPFCEGDTIELDAGAGYARYGWSTGEQTRRLRVSSTGLYRVFVETPEGCRTVSANAAVDFLPRPPVPVISSNGNRSRLWTTDPSTRYVWSLNGIPIPGATADSLSVSWWGFYTVTVFGANGCPRTSAPFEVTQVDVERLPTAFGIEVWPDPNRGTCFVRATLDHPGEVEIAVIDVFGRTRATRRHTANTGSNTIGIDLNGMPAGAYFLLCRMDGKSLVRMITRQ